MCTRRYRRADRRSPDARFVLHDQIAFELATEIDRQHGEENLKQGIDVLLGITMICAVMPAFAMKNLLFTPAFMRRVYWLQVSRDSGDPALLGAS
jgi:hypothetical protein